MYLLYLIGTYAKKYNYEYIADPRDLYLKYMNTYQLTKMNFKYSVIFWTLKYPISNYQWKNIVWVQNNFIL